MYLAALGLCCYAPAFSSCGEQGFLPVVVHRLLIAVVSFVVGHRLWVHRFQCLWCVASAVVAHGPWSMWTLIAVVPGLVASHYVYHVQFCPFQSLDRTPNSNADLPQEKPSLPGDLVKVCLLPRDSVIPILKYLPQFNNKSGVISNGFKVFI